MHAGDDLRHEFQEAVYDGDSDRLRPLCGLLWNLHRQKWPGEIGQRLR